MPYRVMTTAYWQCAGLEFFPGFLNAERRAVVDKAALEYGRLGRYITS